MRKLLALAALLLMPLSAHAQEAGWSVVVTRVVATHVPESPQGIARFGPFRVIDPTHAALVGATDSASPGQFAAMLKAYPAMAELDMLDCAGTEDDIANLRLGRMIRAARLATVVPDGGSVRSGAVELFMAGSTRRIDDGAEFAVHAWEDESGQQATDYAANAPENARYLAYYREMGMDAAQASAFYAMTNSAPFEQPRWLDAAEMRQWAVTNTPATPAPVLAYLDLEPALH